MIFLRIKTFLKSLFFHIKSGLPKSTKEEILYRYNICSSCEDFDEYKSQCNVCGCNINTKSQFLNKLAWADQECPKSKWPKIIR
jgi:hypothetical protein